MRKLMKFLIIIFSLYLFSCNNSSENKNYYPDSGKNIVRSTLLQLEGRWQEEEDSSNMVEFTKSEMIQYYNFTEINRYPVTIFNGLPGQGGYEDPSGRVIQIEESKDNFHHFTIVILDSHYLELKHRGLNQSSFYKRLK